jgi:hypothetical protein
MLKTLSHCARILPAQNKNKQKQKWVTARAPVVACRCASPVVSALVRKKKIKIKNKKTVCKKAAKQATQTRRLSQVNKSSKYKRILPIEGKNLPVLLLFIKQKNLTQALSC